MSVLHLTESQRLARRWRYETRDEAPHASALPRVKWCGRRMTAESVCLVSGARATGYSGVAFCESIWACPVCSAHIRQGRAAEIERAAVAHVNAAGSLAFITMTLPHRRQDPLDVTLRLLTEGWTWIKRQRSVKDALRRLRHLGHVKSVEVTFTAGDVGNGWHPHLHVLVFFDRPDVSPDDLADLRGVFHAQWVAWFARNDWRLPCEAVGVNVQPVTGQGAGVATYLSKVQDDGGRDRHVALEIARGDAKRGRTSATLMPFEILARSGRRRRAGDNRGQGRDVALWREYEAATKGKRCIVWSPGLKDRFGIREKTDEQIIAEQLNEGATVRLPMNRWEWLAVCRAAARHLLIETYDVAGLRAAQSLLAVLLSEDRDRTAGICTDPGGDWCPPEFGEDPWEGWEVA